LRRVPLGTCAADGLVPRSSRRWVAGGGRSPARRSSAVTCCAYTVNEVETIPGYGNCVYAAYGFVHGQVQHRGGINFSSDNGATWTSLTHGYTPHQVPIADLHVDPTNNRRLWVATYGRGIWLYDWGSSLAAACGGP